MSTDIRLVEHLLLHKILLTGIYISASADIAVQAASITDFSADAYTALPIYALGNEYFAMSYVYKGSSAIRQGPSELGMIGVYDRTNIMIILPRDDFVVSFPGYDVRRRGRQLSLTLDRFETYQVSRNAYLLMPSRSLGTWAIDQGTPPFSVCGHLLHFSPDVSHLL